ncbi:MAG: glycosyltransferase family 39 protein [Caldilineaceae bacterium]|nr:glycosyltransferase family 39 protein [Caldilineaceae bacterium]
MHIDWTGLLFVLLPTTLAVVMGWMATAAGPGMNADSVNYLNMAINVQAGRGFMADFVDTYSELPYGPVTFWPPGYSLLIVGPMEVGLNAMTAVRWVSLLALGGLIAATFVLGRRLGGRLCGLLAAMAVASLMPVLRLGTFALSEAPFALFSMLALITAIHYVQAKEQYEKRWLLLCALCIALAILTRYVGVIWLVGLGAIVMWKELRRTVHWLRMLISIALAEIVAVAPVTPWLIRNWLLTGFVTGMDREHKYHADLAGNIRFLVNTLATDLLPPMHLGLRGLLMELPTAGLILMGLGVLVGAAIGVRWIWHRGVVGALFKTRHPDWLRWLCTPQALTFQFIALYLSGMLFLSTTIEFPPYDWPRTAAVIYPCLLALLVSLGHAGWQWLFGRRILHNFSSLQSPLLVLMVAFCLVPYALQTRGFIQAAARGQEFTTAAWRDNQALRAIRAMAETQSIIYSDRAPAAYLYLQRPVRYLPQQSGIAEFYQFLERKAAHPGQIEYVLTFKGELGSNDPYRSSRISYTEMLDLMAERSDIALLADFPDGAIFRIGSNIE